ncbi:ABC transporter ATP-binding protein [Paenibacillus amylolyticus]|uniref:ABC transporter n=1 Tax=Paenibacillus amylolyticus TaxID=1451 RepID=A0A100VRU1_PAEAM|nr:ABC transporter ATP-binding protein [Paenibacillus amylolyticus]GAS84946.1 ABC transporter [Paenibacillus amylolyticus]
MILELKDVTKFYGKHLALHNFSASIQSGEIVGLIGKNGSGKTTLMNCIVNHIQTTSGTILVDSHDVQEQPSLISRFGVLIESSFLDYMNAYDNLKLLMLADGVTDMNKVEYQLNEVLELVGLTKRKKEYVKKFSFGMKQRLGLAQALLNDKPFLILDEPLVGLDVMGRELVKNIIIKKAKQENKAVIFSDHNLNEVKDVCDRIIYIEDGEKKYDGVFDDGRKYEIILEESSSNISALLDKIHVIESVRVVANRIQVADVEILNQVIEEIVTHQVKLQDLNVIEGSLIRLFEGDNEHVELQKHMQH